MLVARLRCLLLQEDGTHAGDTPQRTLDNALGALRREVRAGNPQVTSPVPARVLRPLPARQRRPLAPVLLAELVAPSPVRRCCPFRRLPRAAAAARGARGGGRQLLTQNDALRPAAG